MPGDRGVCRGGSGPDEAHDVIDAAIIVTACVKHRHDAWMVETRSDADLSKEAVGVRIAGAVLAGLLLDGDHASQAGVPRRHDPAHAAGAKLTFEHVAVGTVYI